MADKQIRRRTMLAAGGAGGAALAGGLGLNATAAGPAEAAGAMSGRQVGGGNVLELIGSLNTNFVQHDLAPEGAEMLTGSFTPAYSKVQIAVGSAIANYGTSRAGLLLYVGQPAIPGSRIYDNGGGPLPGVQSFPIGSVGCESGWASTTYRMVEVDVNPAQDVTWTVMAAIIGGANNIPTGVSPLKMAITPDGKNAYITNFGSGTVTPVRLGRPGYSLFNELKPQDEAGTAIATGTWPLGVACDNTHAVVCNFLDATNKVTIIDVATDTVLRHSPLIAGQSPTSVAISTDGQYAYVSTYEGRLFRVTIATGASINITLAAGNDLRGVAVNSTTAFVGNTVTGQVHRVTIPSMTAPAATNVTGSVVEVHAATDGTIWSASRGTNKLCRLSSAGALLNSYTLPYAGVADFAICPPVAPPVVPAPETQPVRTAYVAFDNNKWCQFNIGGVFAGQTHAIHQGDLPGGASHNTGVAVNDYGEIWIVQTALSRVWKFLGGRIYCRAGTTPEVFLGEYLDVFAYGHA